MNITIVGLGLIGGSYAMALKELGVHNVWGVDINQETLLKAENMNIIDKGYDDPKVPLEKSDIVVMCVYPQMVEKFIAENLEYFKNNAIITDTSGTKENIINSIKQNIREDLDFIGGHPMAGAEYRGIEMANKDIFKDATYILTPIESNRLENVSLLQDMIYGMGFKQICELTPSKHDEIMAYTSQLPHILSVALIDKLENDTHNYVAGSFIDCTRVARINGDLWADLFIDNKDNIVKQIDNIQDKLNQIKDLIEHSDKEALSKVLDEARVKKEMLDTNLTICK